MIPGYTDALGIVDLWIPPYWHNFTHDKSTGKRAAIPFNQSSTEAVSIQLASFNRRHTHWPVQFIVCKYTKLGVYYYFGERRNMVDAPLRPCCVGIVKSGGGHIVKDIDTHTQRYKPAIEQQYKHLIHFRLHMDAPKRIHTRCTWKWMHIFVTQRKSGDAHACMCGCTFANKERWKERKNTRKLR